MHEPKGPRPRAWALRPRRDVCLSVQDDTETETILGLETCSKPRRRDRDTSLGQNTIYVKLRNINGILTALITARYDGT